MDHTFSAQHRLFRPGPQWRGKIAFYGGTFDPIHRAHLYVLQQVRKLEDFEALVVMPTAQPPHKRKMQQQRTAAEHRWRMVDLALPQWDNLYLSDYEIVSDHPTYTADTLSAMHEAMPEASLYYVMGGDSFRDLPLWYAPERIAQLAHLMVVVRPDVDMTVMQKRVQEHEAMGGRVTLVVCPGMPESSTALRTLLAEGGDGAGHTVPAVLEYIERHHLYGR